MQELLNRIAVKGTKSRQKEIWNILDELCIPYQLHMFQRNHTRLNDKRRYNTEIHLDQYARTKSEPLYLFAHYDVVPNSTGANDNASSIAILITLAANIIKYGSDIPIRIVFTDLEEYGGQGAQTFCKEHCGNTKITGINLDSCGFGEQIVLCDRYAKQSQILSEFMNRYDNNFCYAKAFPFSDAEILGKNNMNILSMSVFPIEDTFELPEQLGLSVMLSMHNHEYDDIFYINYDIMYQIADILSDFIGCKISQYHQNNTKG